MANKSDSYAVISVAGKQVVVRTGDVIKAEIGTESDTVSFPVLLIKNGSKITVGTPYVDSATAKGSVVSKLRGPKIRVATFKAKSNYHRVKGYRAELSEVTIESI